MHSARQQAAEISLPLLMQVAGDDYLVNAAASRSFFEKVASGDKTLLVYEGLYHEIYNELPDDRTTVLDDLANWLDAHMD
jgi:alpha-beta hydrolase superfamily lysophospholipase